MVGAASQALDERIEQPYEHHQAILIHEQFAVAGLVTRRTNTMQPRQQLPQSAKVLETLQVVLSELAILDGHAEHYAGLNRQTQFAPGRAAFAVNRA